MDLTTPPECDSLIQICQEPTAGNGVYLAIPDSQYGCGGADCDPSDTTGSTNTGCMTGYVCDLTSNTCVPNQSTGAGGCIQENSSGCKVGGGTPGCCNPSDHCDAEGSAGVCRLPLPCGAATDPNCATATCDMSTGKWDESSCMPACTVGNDDPCADAGGNCMCSSSNEANGGPGTCGESLEPPASCNCSSDCVGSAECINGTCGYDCGDYDPNCDTATCDLSTGTWDESSCQDQSCTSDFDCIATGGNCMCNGTCGVSGDIGAGCQCDSDCAGSLACNSGSCDCDGYPPCDGATCGSGGWDTSGCGNCIGNPPCDGATCTAYGWDQSACNTCYGDPPCYGAVCDSIGWDTSYCGGSDCDPLVDPCCGDPCEYGGCPPPPDPSCGELGDDCSFVGCCDGEWCDWGTCEECEWGDPGCEWW